MKTRTTTFFLIIVLSFLLPGQISFAQTTYLYQAKKLIKASGVMEKTDRTEYFTFSGESVYQSDRDGNLATINHITGAKASVYKYCKTIDGNRYYYVWGPIWKNGYMTNGFWENQAIIVASDYSVLNVYFGSMFGIEGSTTVYYRTSESAVEKEKGSQVPGLIR